MAAFAPYRGVYEFGGRSYAWRCYATARVYEVRLADHAPVSFTAQGKKWTAARRYPGDEFFHWLIDAHVAEISQILCEVRLTDDGDDARVAAVAPPSPSQASHRTNQGVRPNGC